MRTKVSVEQLIIFSVLTPTLKTVRFEPDRLLRSCCDAVRVFTYHIIVAGHHNLGELEHQTIAAFRDYLNFTVGSDSSPFVALM